MRGEQPGSHISSNRAASLRGNSSRRGQSSALMTGISISQAGRRADPEQTSGGGGKISGRRVAGAQGCLFSPENSLSARPKQRCHISSVSLGLGPWAGVQLWSPPCVRILLPQSLPQVRNTPETRLPRGTGGTLRGDEIRASSALSLICCSVSKFREGNGTPLQSSCLENPMDGGAW